MNRFVVDASVAVKWFVPEVHTIQALRLLEPNCDLLAPELLLSEVGNILWKKCRRGELETAAGAEILQDLRRSSLAVQPVGPLLSIAWDIAVRYERTFYDSVYLALAVTEHAPLVTADERLCNSLRRTPAADSVLWIGDLQ